MAQAKKLTKTIASDKDKMTALQTALSTIEKQYGKGAVMKLGDPGARRNISVIPTGCLSIDLALGVGGVPRGRIVEIYGPESSGKTTVALHIIAQAQRMGEICAFIDAEHALDPTYARALGVDVEELYVSQPDTGEQALEITEALIRSNAISVVVIDSVAALTPRAEIEGEMGDSHVGLQARLMSQALRKLTGALSKSSTCAVFINQLREKVGVMFGSPETTTGGKALKFYATIRMDVRRIETLKTGQELIGSRTRVKIVKNKVAPPFKVAEFDILYGQGISRESSILDLGSEHDIITKTGSWYSYDGNRIGQGRDNARQFLLDNPELCSNVEAKLRELLFTPASAQGEGAPASEENAGDKGDDKAAAAKKSPAKKPLNKEEFEQKLREEMEMEGEAEMQGEDEALAELDTL